MWRNHPIVHYRIPSPSIVAVVMITGIVLNGSVTHFAIYITLYKFRLGATTHDGRKHHATQAYKLCFFHSVCVLKLKISSLSGGTKPDNPFDKLLPSFCSSKRNDGESSLILLIIVIECWDPLNTPQRTLCLKESYAGHVPRCLLVSHGLSRQVLSILFLFWYCFF